MFQIVPGFRENFTKVKEHIYGKRMEVSRCATNRVLYLAEAKYVRYYLKKAIKKYKQVKAFYSDC